MDGTPTLPLTDRTLDFIFTHIKGAPADQHQVWTALDSKMLSVFGVGSAVIGLAGFALANPTSLAVPIASSWLLASCLCAALAFYVATMAVTFAAIRPKEARQASYGATLWPDGWYVSVREIKRGLVEDITAACAQNNARLAEKADALKVGVVTVGFETLFVGLAYVMHLAGG